MKTATGLITREIFSLSTLFLVILPLLMNGPGPGSYNSNAAWVQAQVQAVADALPVQEIRSHLRYQAQAGAFSLKSQIPSLNGGSAYTAGHAPIFLP